MALQDLLNGFQQNKQEQTSALQSFGSKFQPKSTQPTAPMGPIYGPYQNNNLAGGTPPKVQNPQQQPSNVGKAGQGYWSNTGWVQGAPDQNYLNQAGTTLESLGFSPKSVDINIGNEIDAGALNTTPSPSTLNEKNKGKQDKVKNTRFGKEEERLLKDIQSLRMGLANLQFTQNKEYSAFEKNAPGQYQSGLESDLSRLSKDQAIELSARTGQLNAMLDTLELYQGYRPQMVGNPQIDESTGEAFAYIQDPMTGEIAVQSMGVVTSPVAAEGYTLSKGQIRFDAQGNPLSYGMQDSSGGDGGGGAVQEYADLLAKGLISVSNVPQSIRNAVVVAAGGNVNKSMTTGEITAVADLQNGIDSLYGIRDIVMNNQDKLGPVTGLAAINPWSSSRKIQADLDRVRQKVGKALEGGVLRKEDEIKYKKILSTLTDTPETAAYKINQLISDLTSDLSNYRGGLQTGGRYTGDQSRPSLEELFK